VAKDNLTDSALNIGKILSCAEGNTKKAQEKMKRMSQKSSMQKFNVGDMVWRLNIRSRQRKGGKLDPNFLGAYTVSSVDNKSADLVDVNGVVIPKINIDHLKHHHAQSPHIPQHLKGNLKPASSTVAASTPAATSTAPASPVTDPAKCM
jgi:hypothetical protein